MTAKLHCLGASREVGRSAFLLQTDSRVLLDYGVKIFDEAGKPTYPADISNVKLDAAMISHAHLDHSGYVPNLYRFSKIPWYGTPPTYDIADILWKDTMKIQQHDLPWTNAHYKKAMKYWHPIMYKHKTSVRETTFEFTDAGHIIGAAMIHASYNNKKILYTGDFKLEHSRLHEGAKIPKEKVDALIIETTYADRDHPDRKTLEKKFVDEIKETLNEGGTVLCPAFAVGRSQELIRIIRAHDKDVPIYLDGMSKAVSSIYLKYKKYLYDYENFNRDLDSITFVDNLQDRKNATRGPNVIISTAGMMEGGPALNYIKYLNRESKVLFTGYCVEGTNGWRLQNKGQLRVDKNILEVELPVEYMDFSAHAGRTDLHKLVKSTNPEKVVCVHGDSAQAENFALELKEMGYDAVAPKFEDKLTLF
ncbi:MBL fold metallo-hydrolase [Candidatus Micrarchaeota archaeon]|nr:MBL fold metallo-hydrolase [Candidatus Micrarchaeota archaeon]